MAGPDGALWFTESATNKIGRITTAGVDDGVPDPTAIGPGNRGRPGRGPVVRRVDGGKIGRITTAGVITEFPLPRTTPRVRIAAGPDGALWFTEFDANKIGRITTARAVTEALVPTSDGGAWGSRRDRTGNLVHGVPHRARSGGTRSARLARPGGGPRVSLAGGGLPYGDRRGSRTARSGSPLLGRIGRVATSGPSRRGAGSSSGPQGSCRGRTARSGSRSRRRAAWAASRRRGP